MDFGSPSVIVRSQFCPYVGIHLVDLENSFDLGVTLSLFIAMATRINVQINTPKRFTISANACFAFHASVLPKFSKICQGEHLFRTCENAAYLNPVQSTFSKTVLCLCFIESRLCWVWVCGFD